MSNQISADFDFYSVSRRVPGHPIGGKLSPVGVLAGNRDKIHGEGSREQRKAVGNCARGSSTIPANRNPIRSELHVVYISWLS